MANSYSTPDVYIERTPYVPTVNINATGTYIGGFVGKVKYGFKNTPVLIRSWAEYLDYFVSPTSDNPFEEGSYLPYMVYGFFQNGGSSCYVLNIADSHAAKASKVFSQGRYTATAKYAGAEGNNIWVQRVNTPTYGTRVFYGEDANNLTEVESFYGSDESVEFVNSTSQYITFEKRGNGMTDDNPIRLEGGADSGAIVDGILGNYLTPLDKVFIDMLSYAESGTTLANQALLDYCASRTHYPAHAILGVPSAATTVDEAKTMGNNLSASGKNRGNLYFPWLKVLDSYTGSIVDVPNQGHVQGMIVRTVTSRGRAKVPAGVGAGITGAVGLATDIDLVALGELNVVNVCPIITKANYGIVCWGGRSLFEGGRYISSVIMENQISKDLYDGMQPYVFETNIPETWAKVQNTLSKYMRQCFERGEFDGNKASDAYVVICDGSINTPATIKQKKLNAKVAYKEIGCAEFVIVNLSRDME